MPHIKALVSPAIIQSLPACGTPAIKDKALGPRQYNSFIQTLERIRNSWEEIVMEH